MQPNRDPIGVERTIMEALDALNGLAVTQAELRAITKLRVSTLKNALIRLGRKKMTLNWRASARVNLVVSHKFANSAYFYETVKVNPLYLAFGHSSDTIQVQRSVPFIILTDDGTRKKNRYREMDEEVA